MPYLNLKANGVDEAFDAGRICADASKICAEALGKSEEYMMGSLESVRDMSFGGSTGPAVFVDISRENRGWNGKTFV